MKRKMISITIALITVILISLPCVSASADSGLVFAPPQNEAPITRLDVNGLLDKYLLKTDDDVKTVSFKPEDEVGAIVVLEGQSVFDAARARDLTVPEYLATEEGALHEEALLATQKEAIEEMAQKNIEAEFKYFYTVLLNGFAVTVKYGDLSGIKKIENVTSATLSEYYEAPKADAGNVTNFSISSIYGRNGTEYSGENMLISIIDTGLQIDHEAFSVMPSAVKLDQEDVAGMLEYLIAKDGYTLTIDPDSYDYEYDGELTVEDVYHNAKVPFGFDYCDVDTEVCPDALELEAGYSHGTHVAGIAAGNNGTDFTGVAPNAQIAVMKVFGYNGGAYAFDIIAAISDSIVLGADVINMSLGSGAGFTDPTYNEPYYQAAVDAGVVLAVAAGNDYYLGKAGFYGDQALAENIDFGVVGQSSSFVQSFGVASVNSYKAIRSVIKYGSGNTDLNFNQIPGRDFFKELLGEKQSETYEYVAIGGYGQPSDYESVDVTGKIALVQRGNTSFEDKFLAAEAAGAVACIVFDNEDSGSYINMQMPEGTIPGAFIFKSDGEALVASETKTLLFDMANYEDLGYEMSDFSSWGPTPSLTLKPEITAFGGSIYSAVPYDSWEIMSGTSMATPEIAGLVALAKQFVSDTFPELSDAETAMMIKTLLMNTANQYVQLGKNPYSPRKQGAGVANIDNLVKTKAYLTVDDMSVPKIELGHDPERTGVYELEFDVTNFGTTTLTYTINPIVMCEALGEPTADGRKTVALEEYLLNPSVQYISGVTGGNVTVNAGQTVTVKLTVTLSQSDKDYMEQFPYGDFVDGFVVLTSENGEIADLSVPFLAFYGDWTEAPLFDYTLYDEEQYAIYPGYIAAYKNFSVWSLGGYWYETAPGVEAPNTYNLDRLAISPSYTNGVTNISFISLPALRNMGVNYILFEDINTGNVILQGTEELAVRKLFAQNGVNLNASAYQFAFTGEDLIPFGPLPSNTELRVTVGGSIHWDGNKNTQRTELVYDNITVDNEAPVIVESGLNVYDRDGRLYIDIPVYDNHFIMAGQPYSMVQYEGDETWYVGSSLTDFPVPAYQMKKGTEYVFTYDLTTYYDQIKCGKMAFTVVDYAGNDITYQIALDFSELTVPTRVEFTQDSLTFKTNEVYFDLPLGSDAPFTLPDSVVWSSSNEAVVKVQDGIAKGISQGTATVTAVATYDGDKVFTDTIDITVTEETVEEIIPTSLKLYVNGENVGYNWRQMETWVKYVTWNYQADWAGGDGYNGEMAPFAWMFEVGDTFEYEVKPQPWYANDDIIVKLSPEGTLDWTYDGPFDVLKLWRNENDVVEIDGENITFVKPGYTIVNIWDASAQYFSVDYGEPVIQLYLGAYGANMPPETISVGDVNIDINEPFEIKINQPASCAAPVSVEISGGSGIADIYYDNMLFGVSAGTATYTATATYEYEGQTYTRIAEFNVTVSDTVAEKPAPYGFILTFQGQRFGENGNYDVQENGPRFEVNVGETYELLVEAYPAYADNRVTMNIPNTVAGTPVIEIISNENGRIIFKVVDLYENRYSSEQSYNYSIDSARIWESYTIPELPEDSFYISASAYFYMTTKDLNGVLPAKPDFEITDGVLKRYNGTNSVVVIPSGVTKIDSWALCRTYTKVAITKVVLPEGVAEIAMAAFQDQVSLKEIEFPANSLVTIGGQAFQNTGFERIRIPNSVTALGSYAFSNCTKLKFADLSNQLTRIGDGLFSGCTQLTELKMYEGITALGRYAFKDAPLDELVLPQSLKSIATQSFYESGIKSIEMPYIEWIGEHAFLYARNLAHVEFGDKLVTIGEDAFAYCALTEVFIPKSVKYFDTEGTIEYGTFGYNKIRTVTFEDGIQLESSYEDPCGSVWVGPGYKGIIPVYMFRDNPVENVYIPDTINAIGHYAFYNAPMTGNIHWGGVTKIGNYALYGNGFRGEFHIPEGITFIGKEALLNDTITKLYVPASLEFSSLSIGRGCIVNTDADIVVDPANPVWEVEDGVLYMGNTLIRPLANYYEGAKVFTIREGTRRIETNAFANCEFEAVAVPESVKIVGDYAFGDNVKVVYFRGDAPILEWGSDLSSGYNPQAYVADYRNFAAGTEVLHKEGGAGFSGNNYAHQSVTLDVLDVGAIIGTLPEATSGNKAAYERVRMYFDLLSNTEKEEVGNSHILLEGEKDIELEELQAQTAELQARAEELERRINQLISSINGLSSSNSSLAEAKAELEKALAEVEKAKEAAIRGEADAKEQLDEALAKVGQADDKLEEAQKLMADAERLRSEAEELRNSQRKNDTVYIVLISVLAVAILAAAVIIFRKYKLAK